MYTLITGTTSGIMLYWERVETELQNKIGVRL